MEPKDWLTFGYIRESCKTLNIDPIPHDIVILVAIWVVVCDSFDKQSCDPQIETKEILLEVEDGKRKFQAISRKPMGYYGWSAHTAVGSYIIKNGCKQSWKFRSIRTNKMADIEFIIGIINTKKLHRLRKERDFDRIGEFTTQLLDGYGLYFVRRGRFSHFLFYHGNTYATLSDYPYAILFNSRFRENDTITMTLDLTNEKGGKLIYLIETNENVEIPKSISNVAFNDIDVKSDYSLAVTLYRDGSMLALVQ